MPDEIRRYLDLEARIRTVENRLRDNEWACKLLDKTVAEWEPIIDAAKDQDYLRKWIEHQQAKEAKRFDLTWTRVIAFAGVLAAWTAAVIGIVALVLHH